METALKRQALKLVDQPPENSTFKNLMHEPYEWRSVERAQADVKAGWLTPQDDAKAAALAKLRKAARQSTGLMKPLSKQLLSESNWL